jgi:hypothetical protein
MLLEESTSWTNIYGWKALYARNHFLTFFDSEEEKQRLYQDEVLAGKRFTWLEEQDRTPCE